MSADTSPVQIAVIGPGSIGGLVAAWLGQNDRYAVTVCARSALDDLRIATPGGDIGATPTVLTDPAMAEPVDWVLVATKAYDVDATAPWLSRLVGPQTRVAILQNGVEHYERFRHLLPKDRILPVMVDIPANRTAPGRVTQNAYGTMVVPDGPDGEAFVALFAHSKIDVATDPDMVSRLWRKLCANVIGIVPALTLVPTGASWSPALEDIVRALVAECAEVGRAEGAVIDPALLEALIAGARTSQGINSMHDDRLAGRPMELDARNGVVIRLGAKHGIPTPMNAMMAGLLAAAASSPPLWLRQPGRVPS